MIEANQRRVALLVLALASLSVLYGAREYLLLPGASSGDDASSHVAELLFVAKMLREGSTDFWFPGANLGYPLFLSYQPLATLVFGTVTLLAGEDAVLIVYKLAVTAGFMAMPFAFYAGARWMGLARAHAVIFGLLSLAPSDVHSFGLGFASVLGRGLFTQLFGAILLPLSFGSLYRALFLDPKDTWRASVYFALTLLTHVFFGLLAAIAAMIMLAIEKNGIRARVKTLAIVFLGALPLVAFWVFPFLLNLDAQGGLPWKGPRELGYPILQVLSWALKGALFDQGRLPWLSILAAASIIFACSRTQDRRVRLLLLLASVCLVLWLGWVRIASELEVIRWLSGFQFAVLLIVAIAAGTAFEISRRFQWIFAVPLVVFLGGLSSDVEEGFNLADVGTLVAAAQFLAPNGSPAEGRVLAHAKLHTPDHLHLNLLPALAGREGFISRGRGYHDSPTLYHLESYDFSPGLTRLYRITHAVARDVPEDVPPEWRAVYTRGDLTIYETGERGGHFGFNGASVVLAERSGSNEYSASIDVRDPQDQLLLSVSHHRYWRAYVGGEETPIARTGPNLMSIAAPLGRHEIVFRYRHPWWSKLLLLLIPAAIVVRIGRSRISSPDAPRAPSAPAP